MMVQLFLHMVLSLLLLLLLWQPAVGWIHIRSPLTRLPDVNPSKVLKDVSHSLQDINGHEVMKQVSNDVQGAGHIVEKAAQDLEDLHADKKLKKVIQTVKDSIRIVRVTGTGCECRGPDCGCCVYLDIREIDLDDTVCINITYLPHDIGLSLTFSINGKVYLNETISARNPPPICFDIPDLKNVASACIDFYDLDISKSNFHGCIKLEFRLIHFQMIHVDMGCFNIPLRLDDANHEASVKMMNILDAKKRAQIYVV